MRNIILATFVALLSISAFSQKRSDLTGPAYKNYKSWLHKSEPKIVYTVVKTEKLTGPAYKNKKPWQDKTKSTFVAIEFGSERSKLRGPAYKNYKPWKKNKS